MQYRNIALIDHLCEVLSCVVYGVVLFRRYFSPSRPPGPLLHPGTRPSLHEHRHILGAHSV